MTTLQVQPRPVPRQWQSFITKIRGQLAAGDARNETELKKVLDSLPSFTSFTFHEGTITNKKAISFNIGFRDRSDEVQARSNAYILLARTDIDPPVLFQDEIPPEEGSDAKPQLFPRAATSLLRLACDLLPPFCYLQFDGGDEFQDVRKMLCAVVLYYGLISGLSDAAISWRYFESSLTYALGYISDNVRYYLPLDAEAESKSVTLDEHMTGIEDALPDVAGNPGDAVDDFSDTYARPSQANDDIIRSTGSSIKVKPGSALAEFKKALGDKFELVNAIPSVPIKIEAQNIFPDYAPYRLQLGTHHGHEVYLYLTLDNKGTTRIIAHAENGQQQSWSFFDLRGFDLVEPFSFFMDFGDNTLFTRGHKVRYMAFYYLMLAENAGIIEDLRVPKATSSMLASFCSACKNLESAGRDADSTDTRPESSKTGAAVPEQRKLYDAANLMCVLRSPSKTKAKSLIVKLTVAPEILAAIAENVAFDHRADAADNEDIVKPDVAYGEEDRTRSVIRETPPISVVESESQPLEKVNCDAADVQLHFEATIADQMQDTELYDRQDCINPSRDSGFASSPAPLVGSINGSIADVAIEAEDKPNTRPLEAVPDVVKASSDAQENPHTHPLEALPDVVEALPAVQDQDVWPRSVSIISIGSSLEALDDDPSMPTATAPYDNASSTRKAPAKEPTIIDLGSEDESVRAESPKAEIEETPEVEEVLRPHPQQHIIIDDDDLRLLPPKGKKRKARVVSDDENNDLCEAEDSGAWQRASLRKSQATQSYPEEMWRNWE